jgi:hypothetical protein
MMYWVDNDSTTSSGFWNYNTAEEDSTYGESIDWCVYREEGPEPEVEEPVSMRGVLNGYIEAPTKEVIASRVALRTLEPMQKWRRSINRKRQLALDFRQVSKYPAFHCP